MCSGESDGGEMSLTGLTKMLGEFGCLGACCSGSFSSSVKLLEEVLW